MAMFDHLFLTIGNGYIWSKGELVPDYQDQNGQLDISLDEIKKQGFKKLAEEIPGKPYSEYTLGKWKYQIENVEKLVATNWLDPFEYLHFYGIHEGYSEITLLPDNITPSWFEAAKSFIRTYRMFLNSRYATAEHYWMSKALVQTELDKIPPIEKRFDEIEAHFLNVSNEEYLKIKHKREKRAKEIIEAVVNERK